MQRKLLVIINVDFDTTGQQLIIYSAFIRYLGKNWQNNKAVHQLFIDCKKTYDSFRREVFYNILIECGIPMCLSFHFLVSRLCIGGKYFPSLAFCFDLVTACLLLRKCVGCLMKQ